MLVVGQLRMDPDHGGHAHVGAHSPDAAELHHQVGEGGVGVHVALAGAHALEMVPLEEGDELYGDLDQGLDALRRVYVPLAEGLVRLVHDVHEGALQHRQLRQRLGRKGRAVPLQGGGVVGDVHRMVPQTLELRRDLIILVQDGYMVREAKLGQKAHDVLADLVGHAVDLVLVGLDLHMDRRVVFLQKAEALLNVRAGRAQDGQQQVVTALEGQRRGLVEHRVQRFDHVLELALLHRIVLHDPPAHFFIGGAQGQQGQGAAQVEDGVGVGDDAGVDGLFPEAVQQPQLVGHDHPRQHQDGFAQVV